MDDLQIKEVFRKLPFSNMQEMVYWSDILRRYPLSETKMKLVIKFDESSKVHGILIDHLMSTAKKIGIPNVFINDLGNARNERNIWRQYGYGNLEMLRTKNVLISKTFRMLQAVTEILNKEK